MSIVDKATFGVCENLLTRLPKSHRVGKVQMWGSSTWHLNTQQQEANPNCWQEVEAAVVPSGEQSSHYHGIQRPTCAVASSTAWRGNQASLALCSGVALEPGGVSKDCTAL